jgi:hypothetical protein
MNKKYIVMVFSMLIFLLIICISINCYSIKEGLDNSDAINIPADGVIPDGYYKIDDITMKKIPYGYTTNTEKTELLPNTQSAFWSDYVKKKDNVMDDPILNSKKYNSDNYDLLYHDSEETIKYQSGLYGSEFGTTMILDSCGNKILIPYSQVQGYPIYYKPGSYKYGASKYIPTYEDSVFLSKAKPKKMPLSSKIIKNNFPEKKYQKNVVYLKPQFISLSTYVPNNSETIYSSKTSGIDTTSAYNCK